MTKKEKRKAVRWIWKRRMAWNSNKCRTVSGLYYEQLYDIRWFFGWKPFGGRDEMDK
jgi:hypothetical protein